ncbi:MAG: dihydrodipicolinate synthase family protein [Candidatus Electryonea clarkiae]|nr:dihydrodipicolinate synthase family protein [Candidatus Electryonea clarkiae]
MLTRAELIGPWAGLPVAWKEDFSFDEDAYRANVERTCKAGVPGIYTGGTTGEFYAMEFDEFQAVTKATVEECKRCGIPVMIGITATYTLGAQRRAGYAAKLGADAVQLAMPFWMEIDDREIVQFVLDIASTCPKLALCMYETTRSKKTLTVEQHQAIQKAVPAYQAVKSNANTVGRTPEGCAALSEFINVWVGEDALAKLGPYGAIGSASALVYMNPRIILHMFELLLQKKWDELKVWTDRVKFHLEVGLAPFEAKGFTDTAYDHLQGLVAGFLKMHPCSRGPYISATEEDVKILRKWLKENIPEFLDL